jgi:hypothetical protein
MRKDTQDKWLRLQELEKQKAEIEAEVERILSPETVVALPPGFDMNAEIIEAVRGSDGISGDEVYKKICTKWKAQVDRRKMNSAIIYLVNRKKSLERVDRGKYRIPQPTT